MPSLVHVTDKTSHFTILSETIYNFLTLPNSPHSDLVVISSNNVEMYMHQAILVNLSPMLKTILVDHSHKGDMPLIYLEQDSGMVRKMVEIIYTGKTMVGKNDIEAMKCLLTCLDIGICVAEENNGDVQGIELEELEVFLDQDVNSVLEKKQLKEQNASMTLMKTRSTRNEAVDNLCGDDQQVQVAWYSSVKNFSLSSSLQATVQLEQCGQDGLTKKVRHALPRPKEDSGKTKDKPHPLKVTVPAPRKTSAELSCPECGKSAKYKVKMIKHLVDEHYYEELENVLVGEFLESSVCCRMDFSNTGLGMFIRHKADKHRAVQKVAHKDVVDLLDRNDEHVSSVNSAKDTKVLFPRRSLWRVKSFANKTNCDNLVEETAEN